MRCDKPAWVTSRQNTPPWLLQAFSPDGVPLSGGAFLYYDLIETGMPRRACYFLIVIVFVVDGFSGG
jgi:hypothetical protein